MLLLRKFKIPIEKWGVGEAKTLEHLLSEIKSGECSLIQDEKELTRFVRGVIVNVLYGENGKKLKLVEAKQVFSDGRERERDLTSGISEKLRSGEHSAQGAYRALREELGITQELRLIRRPMQVKARVSSQSYPGMVTTYVHEVFEVELLDHLYRPEGYQEYQPDKTSYFVWRKA